MFCIARIRLGTDPRNIQTRTGSPMVTAFGFAYIGSEDRDLPLSIVAFGSLADELAKYRKGDAIRVSGDFQANDYTNRDGQPVEGFQITADGIAGIKSARGRYRESRPKKEKAEANAATEAFYDDPLAF